MGTTGGITSTAGGASTSVGASAPDLEALSASARGWHRIQLAVLGFIGFCGILWEGDPSNPTPVQYAGLVLIVAAVVLAVLSILLVGRVAHPVEGPTAEVDAATTAAHRRRRLHRGIWGTYLAVVLLVLATLSSWLPSGAAAGQDVAAAAASSGGETVVMVDVEARTWWCGELLGGGDDLVRLRTTEGTVERPADRVVLQPVEAC